MGLPEKVEVARRFQRSVRIDTDLNLKDALEGFICPQSSLDVLLSMTRHISKNQGAFTWTGPYGSGKSSLVIALSALLSGKLKSRRQAAEIIDVDTAQEVCSALPPKTNGWNILPVVGRRDEPVKVIGEAIIDGGFTVKGHSSPDTWTARELVNILEAIAHSDTKSGGLIVFIDEMGKFLEGAALEGSDLNLFQDLAEISNRSEGKLIVVGILHQSFEDYGRRLSRSMRDEWTKIQGRFIDLPVDTGGEEQIELLSQAIETTNPSFTADIAQKTVDIISTQRPNTSPYLAKTLTNCWPLHPATACLLGPISKRRFGQNQRSIFGFLNSAENDGFQYFLSTAENKSLYMPWMLWDYLRINLEPAILASPDGHRWALAADIVERCEATGASELQILLLKTIAVVDLFRERSGLVPSTAFLQICTSDKVSLNELKEALHQLKSWSFIIYKKHLDAFAIFAGSDFDIEQAIETELEETREIDFDLLQNLANMQPILAKRHFHETGTLRWFEVGLVPLNNLVEEAEKHLPSKGTVGQFLLAIPSENETKEEAQKICADAARIAIQNNVIIGLSDYSWLIKDRSRELIATERVRQESPELAGDDVARREVQARLATLQGNLEAELAQAFDSGRWFVNAETPEPFRYSQLNGVASRISDHLFSLAPRLNNELLNRHKPSSSAVAAQNSLLKLMVSEYQRERLGIEGFPAEGGLYVSLLEGTKLHARGSNAWEFIKPSYDNGDLHRLAPIWEATEKYLRDNSDRTVKISEIYNIWREPPYGVRDGIMPILAVAFILSCEETVALYREGIYQANFKDLDVEHLVIDSSDIQVRWMDLSSASRRLLSGMADIVRELDPSNQLRDLKPIDVARGLISIFDSIAPWTLRTSYLSKNALKLRDIFKKAYDPNQLIFNDLPAYSEAQDEQFSKAGVAKIVTEVHDGLKELVDAYPSLVQRFYQVILTELGVPNYSPQSLLDLRARAENIRGIAGDFKLDAFSGRLASFNGSIEEVEGLASLTISKPLHAWIDTDADKAMVEVARMSQQFNKAEAFAHVKGRKNKRRSMAIVTSTDGISTPLIGEFDIGDAEQTLVNSVVKEIEQALSNVGQVRKEIALAALANVSARYISELDSVESVEKEGIAI